MTHVTSSHSQFSRLLHLHWLFFALPAYAAFHKLRVSTKNTAKQYEQSIHIIIYAKLLPEIYQSMNHTRLWKLLTAMLCYIYLYLTFNCNANGIFKTDFNVFFYVFFRLCLCYACAKLEIISTLKYYVTDPPRTKAQMA